MNIKYNISEEIITEYLDKFSNRNLLEILDNPINQLQDYRSIESLETYYASEGIGGIKLLKMLGNFYSGMWWWISYCITISSIRSGKNSFGGLRYC